MLAALFGLMYMLDRDLAELIAVHLRALAVLALGMLERHLHVVLRRIRWWGIAPPGSLFLCRRRRWLARPGRADPRVFGLGL